MKGKLISKFACALFLFPVACLLSGCYGAIHNQISYTVSPEYFTKFKFEQFEIAPAIPDRQGAAIVGWRASWWMGLVLGILLIPFGLLLRDTKTYLFWMLRVFGLVLITTVCVGSLGLLAACFVHPDSANEELMFRGNTISDPTGFLRAGFMHNASYLGGFLGVLVGMASILRKFLRIESETNKS